MPCTSPSARPAAPAPVKCAICRYPLDENQRKPFAQFWVCAKDCQPEPILSRMDDPNDVDVSGEA